MDTFENLEAKTADFAQSGKSADFHLAAATRAHSVFAGLDDFIGLGPSQESTRGTDPGGELIQPIAADVIELGFFDSHRGLE